MRWQWQSKLPESPFPCSKPPPNMVDCVRAAAFAGHHAFFSKPLASTTTSPNSNLIQMNSISTVSEPRMVFQEERGLAFQVGSAFYRRQSAIARDLGVLAAAAHAQQIGRELRILDAMSGCGVRAARYLHQAGASFVWANDACPDLSGILHSNLAQNCAGGAGEDGEDGERWRITHEDANKLLLGAAVREDYFDVVDVDSFGSDSLCLGPALGAVRFGGLVYATSTDGFSSGGHRPYKSLGAYGAFMNPMPHANEMGLRMLIGGAVREAATRNMDVFPVFSNYSHHGPVFRVMLRAQPGRSLKNRNYGFVVFCKLCGESKPHPWENLGEMSCSCSYPKESGSLVVSGPLWIGPLHSTADVQNLQSLAKSWGWIGNPFGDGKRASVEMQSLEQLLEIMLIESHSSLPPGYVELSKIAKRGKLQTPRRADFIEVLRQEGYIAGQSHVESNAVKTNCSLKTCIELARNMQ